MPEIYLSLIHIQMCIRDRGNLVNRTISMTNKYFGGTVTNKGVTEEVDADLKAVTENTPKLVERCV